MKPIRWIAVLLCVLLLALAASCGGKEPQTGEAASATARDASQTDAGPSAQAYANGFTFEDLARENTVSTLVSAYRNVQLLRYENDELICETYYFDHGGETVWVRRTIDPDLGETLSCGDRDALYFQEDDHLQFSCALEENADSGEDYDFDFDVCAQLLDGTVTNIESAGDDLWRFELRDAEYASDVVCRCTATKQTLTLKTIKWEYGDGDKSVIEMYCGDNINVPDFGLLQGFDKPSRKVTCVCTLHDEDAKPTTATHTFDVPYNAEPLFVCSRELNLYLDAGFTKEYVYPGDGVDYTVYATDAMG